MWPHLILEGCVWGRGSLRFPDPLDVELSHPRGESGLLTNQRGRPPNDLARKSSWTCLAKTQGPPKPQPPAHAHISSGSPSSSSLHLVYASPHSPAPRHSCLQCTYICAKPSPISEPLQSPSCLGSSFLLPSSYLLGTQTPALQKKKKKKNFPLPSLLVFLYHR